MQTQLNNPKRSKRILFFQVALLMLLALALRIPTLYMGLWLDECITIFVCTQPTLEEMVSHLIVQDFNPPLSHLITRAFISIFGTGEVIVRIPALIFGILLVPAMYWLGRVSVSARVGLWCAFFVALSPIANFFACQARPYSLGLLTGALMTTFFCRLVKGMGSRWVNIIGYAFTSTAFCYTNTLGVLLPGAFFLAGILIVYLDSKESDEAESVKSSLRPLDPFLTVAAPFFTILPWVPNVLMQAKQPLGCDPGGLTRAPLIFAYNLVMMIPIPIWMGLLLVFGGAVVLFIGLIKLSIKHMTGSKKELSFDFVRKIPRHLLALIVAVVVPSCIVGVVSPFAIGYFRYVVPFSPAGWVLVAILVEKLIERKSGPQGRFSRSTLTLIVAAFVFISDVTYVIIFDQRHLSGLRGMARAIDAGEFDNSIIIIGPDQPSCTLAYYLPEAKRKAHNVVLHGYPRWYAENPIPVPDQDPVWNNKEASAESMRHINKLLGKGYKYLVLASDKHYMRNLKTRKMKDRVIELVQKLEKQFGKPIKSTLYEGLVENVDVSVYNLTAKEGSTKEIRQSKD